MNTVLVREDTNPWGCLELAESHHPLSCFAALLYLAATTVPSRTVRRTHSVTIVTPIACLSLKLSGTNISLFSNLPDQPMSCFHHC